MKRLHNSLVLFLAGLALAGMLNWAATCCCGRSLLLEFVEGSCCPEGHEHARSHVAHHLPGQHSSTCHKHGSESYVPSQEAPDVSLLALAPCPWTSLSAHSSARSSAASSSFSPTVALAPRARSSGLPDSIRLLL